MPPFAFPSRLYPIIDTLGDPRRSHVDLAQRVLAAGVGLLQLRVKDCPTRQFVEIARAVKSLADQHDAQLIVNDRADVAKLIEAAGVHLGQSDLPADAARQVLGPTKVIGVSTHSLDEAAAAARQGVADYLGFGPIFPTTSKRKLDPVQGLDGLRQARRAVRLPIVAIGGITATSMPAVLSAGADAVAMIGEIVRADDVTTMVRSLMQAADTGCAPRTGR
jgi:thiamine-phosphate pyrophosphorylase